MVEAALTAAAPAAIWVIIVVAVLCLAFWLTAVMVADRRQATLSRRQRMPDVPDTQAGPVTQARGRHARPENGAPTEAPPSADLAGRQEALGRHAMPMRRGGAADRVERTLTGPGSPDRDDGEYW